jgi:hypothetical protein
LVSSRFREAKTGIHEHGADRKPRRRCTAF